MPPFLLAGVVEVCSLCEANTRLRGPLESGPHPLYGRESAPRKSARRVLEAVNEAPNPSSVRGFVRERVLTVDVFGVAVGAAGILGARMTRALDALGLPVVVAALPLSTRPTVLEVAVGIEHPVVVLGVLEIILRG